MTRAARALTVTAAALTLVACTSGSTSAATTSTGRVTPAGTGGTVWLCRPGLADDPCTGALTATAVGADGRTSVRHAAPAKNPPIDCFYVYPTASTQATPNAALRVDDGVRTAAVLQASRFSQVCRVYAPVYRQLTLSGLAQTGVIGQPPPPGTPKPNLTDPYADVAAAWHDYLTHYNHGRGVVLIGHSQGSFLLIQLVRDQIENHPSLRRRIVSAILPGGNVEVSASPSTPGSTFTRFPPCRSNRQTRCVVAYSSFPSEPPPGAIFGRVGGPTSSAPSGSQRGLMVQCTDPADLSGGTGNLDPYFPTDQNLLVDGTNQPTVTTPWVEYPGLFRSVCMHEGGASWLQVEDVRPGGDTRPHLAEALGPGWGYHLDDINLALGNLVNLVCEQSGAYLHRAVACPAP